MEKLERRAAEIRDRQVGITARRVEITKESNSAASLLLEGPTEVRDYLSLKLRYLQREREMLTAESDMLVAELRLLQAARKEEETRHE